MDVEVMIMALDMVIWWCVMNDDPFLMHFFVVQMRCLIYLVY